MSDYEWTQHALDRVGERFPEWDVESISRQLDTATLPGKKWRKKIKSLCPVSKNYHEGTWEDGCRRYWKRIGSVVIVLKAPVEDSCRRPHKVVTLFDTMCS